MNSCIPRMLLIYAVVQAWERWKKNICISYGIIKAREEVVVKQMRRQMWGVKSLQLEEINDKKSNLSRYVSWSDPPRSRVGFSLKTDLVSYCVPFGSHMSTNLIQYNSPWCKNRLRIAKWSIQRNFMMNSVCFTYTIYRWLARKSTKMTDHPLIKRK